MSKLDELINQLCPDGVEFVKIGDVVNFEQPSKYIVRSTDYSDDFSMPVLTAGQTFILGYTNETDNTYLASRDKPVIIFDDFTGAFKWVDFEFKVKSSAMKMLTVANDRTTLRYIYHVMGNIGFSSSEHKRLWIGIYSEFLIPLPPLEVQSEIVRILDNFTELTAELTAELASRKKQYEYYSQQLLLSIDAESVPISDLGKWMGGKTPSMNNKQYWEGGIIPWISSKDMKAAVLSDTQDHITEHAVNDASMTVFPAGTVAIVTRSGILKHTFPVVYVPFETTINQDIKALKVNEGVSARYVSLAMQAFSEDIRKKTKKQGGTVDSLEFSKVLSYKIPLPSYEKQLEVVGILERFDSLCNSLSNGLPAEIDARQKQYEFYRDKLLTFKEKAIS